MARVVYGLWPVAELLRGRGDVSVVYLSAGARSPALAAIADAAVRRKVAVEERDRDELIALAAGGVHQGAVAIAGDFVFVEPETVVAAATARGEVPLILALDGIQDPHNLGALARSAHVLGAHGLVIPKDRAARVTPAAVKASAGATEHIPIALCTNLVCTLESFKESGLWIVGALAEGGSDPWDIDFTQPTVLVLGAEGTGLRPLVARACDLRVRIPMSGRVASLNVSTAGAILLYEAVRQRRGPAPG